MTNLFSKYLPIAVPVDVKPMFNPNAFKEAFFWPVENVTKQKTIGKTTKKVAPKLPSVMSSEEWRAYQRQQNEEKMQQQAQKDARKAAREAKKLESAKMAAEKLVLKEQKIAAAKKAAEKKALARTGKKKTVSRKRSSKATKD